MILLGLIVFLVIPVILYGACSVLTLHQDEIALSFMITMFFYGLLLFFTIVGYLN